MNAILQFLAQPFAAATPVELALHALDIGIVSYLVYRLLLIVRGTRSASLALGFLLVWIAFVVSPLVGLHTLHRVFKLLFSELSMFVIFALIIFQNEIRRAMAQVGRFRMTTPVLEAQSIEEVVQAAGALARKRLGAIIVFEGKASLDEYVSEGTVVDAALTRESIYSYFLPSFENPLHDGAVIIRGLRIFKAGALLPLTTRHDLAKSLGTRHRAAIGLTEQTDAVTVVVSEERGVISACIDGNILQDLDMANLRKLLQSRFRRAREQSRGWNPFEWWREHRRRDLAERKTVIIEATGAAPSSSPSSPRLSVPPAGPSGGRSSVPPPGPSVGSNPVPPPEPVRQPEPAAARPGRAVVLTAVKSPTADASGKPDADPEVEIDDLGDSKSFAEFLGNKS